MQFLNKTPNFECSLDVLVQMQYILLVCLLYVKRNCPTYSDYFISFLRIIRTCNQASSPSFLCEFSGPMLALQHLRFILTFPLNADTASGWHSLSLKTCWWCSHIYGVLRCAKNAIHSHSVLLTWLVYPYFSFAYRTFDFLVCTKVFNLQCSLY